MKLHTRTPAHHRLICLAALGAALCLTMVTAFAAFADTVHIYDASHVLDQAQVQSEAANLSYPVDIYTTNTFNGSSTAFDQHMAGYIGKNLDLVVIAIDTRHRHL